MSKDKIKAAVKVECDRQGVGEDRQRFLSDVYGWIRENAVEKKEKRLAHMSMVLSRNELRMMQGFRENDEVELTDMYGNKIYATKKGSW